MSDTQQVFIRMVVWPSHSRPTPWLTHDPAFGTSTVSIAHEVANYPGPLNIVGAYLDGKGFSAHRVIDGTTVIVSPRIPDRGGYLTILCEAPHRPCKGPTDGLPGIPRPDDTYGLQRAVIRSQGQQP